MLSVLQRVRQASVTVEGKIVGEIGHGLLVLEDNRLLGLVTMDDIVGTVMDLIE